MSANPTIALSSSYPLPDGNNQVPSVDYLKNAITSLLITGLGRDNALAAQRPITVASSQPANLESGEHWLDTSTTPWTLRYFDGANAAAVLWVGATAPAWAHEGYVWYDTTNDIARRYGTKNGHTGWHGSDAGLLLMTNRSGATVTRGMVAVRDTTGTTVQEATTTTTVKDTSVVGVWLEDTDNGNDGLVATVQSGMVVPVLVDSAEADGAVAKGDWLCTYSTAGEARTVGAAGADAFIAADHGREYGVPLGAFAEALSTKDGNNLVTARLLGQVGQGRTVYRARSSLVASMTFDGTWQEVQLTSPLAKVKPLVGAYFSAILTEDTGAGEGNADVQFELSVNQNANILVGLTGRTTGSDGQTDRHMPPTWCPTSSGAGDSYGALGEYVSYKGSTPTGTMAQAVLYTHGWVY